MRLFVSYARVDRPFCEQIVKTLQTAHEVWYDRRLHAGKKWWEQIQQKLDWCEGFIYLLSPESIESEYCQKEYAIVRMDGKPIFPVKIQANADIPTDLLEIQIADFSEGLTGNAVAILMAGINVIEREGWQEKAAVLPAPSQEPVEAPVVETESEGHRIYSEAIEAYHNDDLDRALFALLQVKESDYHPPFIDLDSVIAQVQGELDRLVYLKEARRAYEPILRMVTREKTRLLGCQAFEKFSEEFPDYDPDGITEICEQEPVPRGDINVTVGGSVYRELNVAEHDVNQELHAKRTDTPDSIADEDAVDDDWLSRVLSGAGPSSQTKGESTLPQSVEAAEDAVDDDWLIEITPSSETEEEDALAWLAQLAESEAEENTASSELPDWLSASAPSSEAEEEAVRPWYAKGNDSEEEKSPASTELPDWLIDEEEEPSSDESDLPDWLIDE